MASGFTFQLVQLLVFSAFSTTEFTLCPIQLAQTSFLYAAFMLNPLSVTKKTTLCSRCLVRL